MTKKKAAPSKKQKPNKTYTIQRGGEDFKVFEAATAFAVKRKRVSSSAELIAVAQTPDRFPGLRFDKDRSPRGVELYYVDKSARDSAMAIRVKTLAAAANRSVWAISRLAISSLMADPRKMIRSRKTRE